MLTGVVGCSGRLKTHPVNGRVQFVGGAPARLGNIEFTSREHAIQARGTIASDGTFSLSTYEEGDGAVAGLHDCVIVQFVVTEDIAGHRPSTLGVIDRKYGNYATSGLEVEIEPDVRNEIVIEIEPLRKSSRQEPHEHSHHEHSP